MGTILETLLQRLVSFVKFIADRGLAWRLKEMMKTLGRPETFSKKNFKTFFKQIFKKRRCDASGDRFCNSFTNF